MGSLKFDVVGRYLVCVMQKWMFPSGVNAEYPGYAYEEEHPSPTMARSEKEHLQTPLRAVGEWEEHGECHRRGGIIVRSWTVVSMEDISKARQETADFVKLRRRRYRARAVGR